RSFAQVRSPFDCVDCMNLTTPRSRRRAQQSGAIGEIGLSFRRDDAILLGLSGCGLTHSGVDESLCRSHALPLLGSLALSQLESRRPKLVPCVCSSGPAPSGDFGPPSPPVSFAAGVRSRAVSLWAISPRGKS